MIYLSGLVRIGKEGEKDEEKKKHSGTAGALRQNVQSCIQDCRVYRSDYSVFYCVSRSLHHGNAVNSSFTAKVINVVMRATTIGSKKDFIITSFAAIHRYSV